MLFLAIVVMEWVLVDGVGEEKSGEVSKEVENGLCRLLVVLVDCSG